MSLFLWAYVHLKTILVWWSAKSGHTSVLLQTLQFYQKYLITGSKTVVSSKI